ncbi:MAG: hypothetical protein H8E37_00805 [Planctomycetes bacterium]|nr:hypothetical protein [Planctomycetota bacterium]
MRRLTPTLTLLLLTSGLFAQAEDVRIHLDAPKGWRGEAISLPPGFARDMSWKGLEEVRFAPGMFDAKADDFFSYVFVFYLPEAKKPDEKVLTKELLKYYRGLATAVARNKGGVDADSFKLTIKKVERTTGDATTPSKPESEVKSTVSKLKPDVRFHGTLNWTEPFATMKPQRLFFEIQSGPCPNRKARFLAVSVSPQKPVKAKELWTSMRRILGTTEFRAAGSDTKPER